MSKRDKTLTEIRKAIMEKLGIKKSTLSNMITKLINSLPISIPREYATYIIAKENNVLGKIADEKREKLNQYLIQIADMKPKEVMKPPKEKETKKKTAKSKSTRTININIGKFNLKNTNLKPNRINEAYEMAELYFYLNIFENSIRYFVLEIMNKKRSDWWDSLVDQNIRDYVDKVMKNRKKGWLWKNEPHPLFYTTFGQLVLIIEQNWQEFKHIFMRLDNLKWFINPIKDIRNPIAHNNIISETNKKLLLSHIQQWFDYMNTLSP